MEETGYAKVNLALHVRAREADGYHRIETLFAFCEDGDRLSVARADELLLYVRGPFAASVPLGEDNLVLRAARALQERFGAPGGAALTLDKRLPVASGIGGGSADAAAALRLLCRWWNLPAQAHTLLELGRGLGADVPACVLSRPSLGRGRGDDLELIDQPRLRGAPVLLVNPLIRLSTGDVFEAWDGVDRGALAAADAPGRNDLQPAAVKLVPEIAAILSALQALAGLTFAGMSGSGATCFALFESMAARDAAAASLAADRPGWWLLPTRLR